MIAFSVYFLTNVPLRQQVLKDDVIFKNRFYSGFTKFLILVSGRVIQISTLVTCCINFWRQEKVLNLMMKVKEVRMNAKLLPRLRRMWRREFMLVSCSIAVLQTLAFVSKMKISMLSLVVHMITSIPYNFVVAFLTFIKTFEILFVILLEDFRLNMKSLNQSKLCSRDFEYLTRKYHKIYEMNKEFAKVFGHQITIIVCCITAMIIFQVNQFW